MSTVTIDVEVDVEDVLREANKSDIIEFAKEKFNIFEGLEEIEDEDLIDELNKRGYEVQDKEKLEELYYPDSTYLEEIINKFYSLDCFSREKIYKQIIKL